MHRAAQIIEAAAAAIAAQTDIAAEVLTNSTLSLSADDQELSAVCVNLGADSAGDEDGYINLAFIDSTVEVKLVLYAQESTQNEVVAELMRLRSCCHRAMLASPRDLGLPFVMGIRYAGAAEPELSTEGARLGGRMECTFPVLYRMNLTDPE